MWSKFLTECSQASVSENKDRFWSASEMFHMEHFWNLPALNAKLDR